MGTEGIFGRARQTLLILDQQGLSEEQIDRLHSGGHLAALARAVKEGALPDLKTFRETVGLDPELFRLVVNYSLSLDEMVIVSGSDVASRVKQRCLIAPHLYFPETTGTAWFEARYFRFTAEIATAAVDSAIAQSDPGGRWSLAGIEHMLAHSALYPERQRRFPVVGFCPAPAVLTHKDGRRILHLASEGFWQPVCRFLAVRPLNVA